MRVKFVQPISSAARAVSSRVGAARSAPPGSVKFA
jgi:hypothetical protein